jgi:hypothetical protein
MEALKLCHGLFVKPVRDRSLRRLQAKALQEFRAQYGSLSDLESSTFVARQDDTCCKLAVVSAYCGTTSLATFKPGSVNSHYPHYFASNNEDILAQAVQAGYKPIYMNCEVSDDPILSCYQAKLPKIVPHKFKLFCQYEFLLWKDDKVLVDMSRIDEFIGLLNYQHMSMALRPHDFLSGNILLEFAESMHQERYKQQRQQYVSYLADEFENGAALQCQMYWCSVILRNMRHPDSIKISNLWWEHMNRCGIQDQISFDVVAQKFASIMLLPPDFPAF